jgi:hypothetical protein
MVPILWLMALASRNRLSPCMDHPLVRSSQYWRRRTTLAGSKGQPSACTMRTSRHQLLVGPAWIAEPLVLAPVRLQLADAPNGRPTRGTDPDMASAHERGAGPGVGQQPLAGPEALPTSA